MQTLAGAPPPKTTTPASTDARRRASSSTPSNKSGTIPDSAEAQFNDTGGGSTPGLPGNNDIVWHINARYSDFVRLHNSLLTLGGFREDDLPSLPPKKWLFNQDPNFVEKRMGDLQKYTSMLLLDPRIARSPLVTSFFKVSENLIMLKAAKNMPYSSSPRVRGRHHHLSDSNRKVVLQVLSE